MITFHVSSITFFHTSPSTFRYEVYYSDRTRQISKVTYDMANFNYMIDLRNIKTSKNGEINYNKKSYFQRMHYCSWERRGKEGETEREGRRRGRERNICWKRMMKKKNNVYIFFILVFVITSIQFGPSNHIIFFFLTWLTFWLTLRIKMINECRVRDYFIFFMSKRLKWH
jgi:hypothetical protein